MTIAIDFILDFLVDLSPPPIAPSPLRFHVTSRTLNCYR
jgi:hypothetical protein